MVLVGFVNRLLSEIHIVQIFLIHKIQRLTSEAGITFVEFVLLDDLGRGQLVEGGQLVHVERGQLLVLGLGRVVQVERSG